MTEPGANGQTLGWIGIGRMGEVLADPTAGSGMRSHRLQPHQREGEATGRSRSPRRRTAVDLADRDIVITMVAGSSDFEEVMTGPEGLLADPSCAPGLVVDASTVSMDGVGRDPRARRHCGAWRSWPLR